MSKSNKCPIDSSSSSDKDYRNYEYRQHNHRKTDNPLSHICKYLDVNDSQKSSKDNVELALEVEINESLKHALTNPDRNNTDLLDVTIIRPSDSDTTHETTVALNKDEVRDFISLVEQHHRHQETNYSEKSKENRSKNDDNTSEDNQQEKSQRHRSRKQHKQDIKQRKDVEHGEEPQKAEDKSEKIDENAKHVYATLNTFDKIKHTLPCQNKERDADKPGTPCMCQHCGIVGVLVQSQKGPVAPFPPLEESQPRATPRSSLNKTKDQSGKESKLRKIVDVKKRKSIDQLHLLREINARIKSLERRISIQEETAVPREYLKHILHKVLTQYNFKSTAQQHSREVTKLRNNATQYSTKNIVTDMGCQKNSNSPDRRKGDDLRRTYQVQAVLDDHPKWMSYAKTPESNSRNNVNVGGSQKSSKDNLYWLWGEEVVKPGCDLKNKILKLLDDKLRSNREEKKSTIPVKAPVIHYDRPEKISGAYKNTGIRIEKDEKTIILNNVDNGTSLPPVGNYNYLIQGNQLEVVIPNKEDAICSPSLRNPPLPRNNNNFSNLRSISPKTNYPFDVKKTIDDTLFKRNIEAQKEKIKEKPTPPLEEKYFNSYACNSITTESQASINYILQKLKNNAKIAETGLPREREEQLDHMYNLPKHKEEPCSVIKDNLHRCCFRTKKEHEKPPGESVDIKFVSPKIKHWSEESSTSEDKLLRQRVKNAIDKKEPVTLEKKESLIYKLDFLKNLARNKSTDQSRVLNRIWTQAKNTAKSKKDAVYIKIPFKSVNTSEAQDNLIEMHLTLEELETVVKAAKMTSSASSNANLKVATYKSTSEIDFGQRKHQEMKYANREILKRRQLSAKTNRHKEKRQYL